MPSVIVPVGLSMGPRFRYVRPPDPVPECFEVHLADDVAELSAGEFAAWGAAFLEPERHARLEIDRASLVRFLATAPRPEPRAADLVTVLVERGLLLELDTDGPLENVFSQHKLLPLGEGIGSTAEDPHLYRVAQAGRPAVVLPPEVFTQWAFAFLHPNLWEACTFYADDSEEVADGAEPLGLTPENVAHTVAVHLPVMVATGSAFLDPIVPL